MVGLLFQHADGPGVRGDPVMAMHRSDRSPSDWMNPASSSPTWRSLRSLASRVGVFHARPENRQAPRRAVHGKLTALFRGPRGQTRTTRVSVVNVSESGLAFRSDWEFAVGQTLLISDGEHVVEAAIQHKRPDGDDLVYGVEAILAAPLPGQFAMLVPESFLRLSEELNFPALGVASAPQGR